MTEQDRQKLEDIHACLVGNKLKGQRGLIDRVALCENVNVSHGDKINSIEQKLERKSNKWDWGKIFKFIKIVKPV
jgi:hypothetical protein